MLGEKIIGVKALDGKFMLIGYVGFSSVVLHQELNTKRKAINFLDRLLKGEETFKKPQIAKTINEFNEFKIVDDNGVVVHHHGGIGFFGLTQSNVKQAEKC